MYICDCHLVITLICTYGPIYILVLVLVLGPREVHSPTPPPVCSDVVTKYDKKRVNRVPSIGVVAVPCGSVGQYGLVINWVISHFVGLTHVC